MYETSRLMEQKVPMADQVKHDDLTEALANFQAQLAEVRQHCVAWEGVAVRSCCSDGMVGASCLTQFGLSPRPLACSSLCACVMVAALTPPAAQGKEFIADNKEEQCATLTADVASIRPWELQGIVDSLHAGEELRSPACQWGRAHCPTAAMPVTATPMTPQVAAAQRTSCMLPCTSQLSAARP